MKVLCMRGQSSYIRDVSACRLGLALRDAYSSKEFGARMICLVASMVLDGRAHLHGSVRLCESGLLEGMSAPRLQRGRCPGLLKHSMRVTLIWTLVISLIQLIRHDGAVVLYERNLSANVRW